MLLETTLQDYLGQHIRDICPIGYANDSDNHCAHFVSHVLGYQFGATCRTMKRGQGTPGSIRVHEVFARCVGVGRWGELPVPLFWGSPPINFSSPHKRAAKGDHFADIASGDAAPA